MSLSGATRAQTKNQSVKRMAEEVRNWLRSTQGQNELRELLKRTEAIKRELAGASRVDLDSLNKPMTL